MYRTVRVAKAIIAAAFLTSACGASPSEEEKAVASVLHARFDQPGAELVVDPIAAQGAFAVAGWVQGDKGGRALLQKGSKGWLLVLCGGDSLRSMQGLVRLGVPQQQAVEITKELAREEKKLSDEQLAKMASFMGEVRM